MRFFVVCDIISSTDTAGIVLSGDIKGNDFVFGYVTVAKGQLTEQEYEVFRAYYCGVCKAEGKRASQLSRLGLSYDITFMALVLSSLAEDGNICSERCVAHPIKRHNCVRSNEAVNYAADIGALLSYLKLVDDWHDERSLKALAGIALFYPGYMRVRKRRKTQLEIINEQLAALSRLEKEKCADIDAAADTFAKLLGALFSPDTINNNGDRRALEWMGYNLGRWIYILDAYNDAENDYKTGAYNPFLADGATSPEELKGCRLEDIELALTFTLENIASAFELINFKRNKSIVGKIIYTSLKQKQRLVLSGKGQDIERKCLNRRNDVNESI